MGNNHKRNSVGASGADNRRVFDWDSKTHTLACHIRKVRRRRHRKHNLVRDSSKQAPDSNSRDRPHRSLHNRSSYQHSRNWDMHTKPQAPRSMDRSNFHNAPHSGTHNSQLGRHRQPQKPDREDFVGTCYQCSNNCVFESASSQVPPIDRTGAGNKRIFVVVYRQGDSRLARKSLKSSNITKILLAILAMIPPSKARDDSELDPTCPHGPPGIADDRSCAGGAVLLRSTGVSRYSTPFVFVRRSLVGT